MKKLINSCIIAMFIMVLLPIVSKAASFDASVSKTEVKVGDTFTVTIKADNAARYV